MPDLPLRDHLIELARDAAVRRMSAEELAREEAILDGYELDKLHATFQVRALLERWGVDKIETWIAVQAQELRKEGKL